jgi:hypothetical protein
MRRFDLVVIRAGCGLSSSSYMPRRYLYEKDVFNVPASLVAACPSCIGIARQRLIYCEASVHYKLSPPNRFPLPQR